jgi:hypothetical protein
VTAPWPNWERVEHVLRCTPTRRFTLAEVSAETCATAEQPVTALHCRIELQRMIERSPYVGGAWVETDGTTWWWKRESAEEN